MKNVLFICLVLICFVGFSQNTSTTLKVEKTPIEFAVNTALPFDTTGYCRVKGAYLYVVTFEDKNGELAVLKCHKAEAIEKEGVYVFQMTVFFEEKVGDTIIEKELPVDCEMSRVKRITVL